MIKLKLAKPKKPMVGDTHIDITAFCLLSFWWAASTLNVRPKARNW